MNILVPSTLVHTARTVAFKAHAGQKYGDEFPYFLHLILTEGVLLRFGIMDECLRAGAYLHDTLEDTTVTFEELESYFPKRVTNAVVAVTEPKGGNRQWRHEMTYPRIYANQDAIMLKLADRISHVEAGGKKVGMYLEEHPYFRRALYREDSPAVTQAMWNYLAQALMATHAP